MQLRAEQGVALRVLYYLYATCIKGVILWSFSVFSLINIYLVSSSFESNPCYLKLYCSQHRMLPLHEIPHEKKDSVAWHLILFQTSP